MKIKNILILGLSTILLTSCGSKKAQELKEVETLQVKTSALKISEINRDIELTSTLEGYLTLNVSSSIQGKISKILVRPSDFIKKGQLLVEMDKTQYNTAKINLSNQEIEMARMDELKKSGAVSNQVYDKTKLGLQTSQENVDYLSENTFLIAPFNGYITAKNFEEGELCAGQTILVLKQIHYLKADINIPETYFPKIKKNIKVNIESDVYPNKSFNAYIDYINPSIDPNTHTFQVRLKIPNDNLKLRPGMFVSTKLIVENTKTLMVPNQSVLKMVGSNDRYIFVNNNGKAKRIFVKLGQRINDEIEIISKELSEGMMQVVVGQEKLFDGAKMNVVK
ncbi:MAG: efflux RND transporter periplasmic adaptor subunit [Bacteroidales bacterium]